jgi:hypothetical protein
VAGPVSYTLTVLSPPARWQVATVHLEGPAPGSVGPADVVLGYRSERLIKRLAERRAAAGSG